MSLKYGLYPFFFSTEGKSTARFFVINASAGASFLVKSLLALIIKNEHPSGQLHLIRCTSVHSARKVAPTFLINCGCRKNSLELNGWDLCGGIVRAACEWSKGAAKRSLFFKGVLQLCCKHKALPTCRRQSIKSSRSPQRPAGEQNYGQWFLFFSFLPKAYLFN